MQTSEKLKKEEKEKTKIQDGEYYCYMRRSVMLNFLPALDEALSRGSDGAAMQIKTRQARIKQLEDNLRKAEDEKDKLRHQASSGDSWGSDEVCSFSAINRATLTLPSAFKSSRAEPTNGSAKRKC